MDKNILEKAMAIATETPSLDIPQEIALKYDGTNSYYKNVYKNIKLFLQQDRVLLDKLKCLEMVEKKVRGKWRAAIKQRIDTIKSSLELIHSRLLQWWETYERCPISIKVSNASVGENVCFGYYECFLENGKPIMSKIAWKVLFKSQNRALLISDLVLDLTPYSYDGAPWATSNLRKWCQKLYANNFTGDEKKHIITANIRTPDVPGGAVTADNVFCLSSTEVQQYMPNDKSRKTSLTQALKDNLLIIWDCAADVVPMNRRSEGWWTRSLSNNSAFAVSVTDHFMSEHMANSLNIPITYSRKLNPDAFKACHLGVRPALWVRTE